VSNPTPNERIRFYCRTDRVVINCTRRLHESPLVRATPEPRRRRLTRRTKYEREIIAPRPDKRYYYYYVDANDTNSRFASGPYNIYIHAHGVAAFETARGGGARDQRTERETNRVTRVLRATEFTKRPRNARRTRS